MTMALTELDLTPVWLTLKLAVITTLCLMIISPLIAWWIVKTKSAWRTWVSSLITLPLVLPPSVLGFYLLSFLGPFGWGGKFSQWLGLGTLPFTFSGLILASIIYSLPFAVQPLVNTFKTIGNRPLEVAATLGASFWDRIFTIILPLARPGLMTAMILSFAHTLGEFGVVLMIGGNIPGETKVLSVAIYEHVETQEYFYAHVLSAGMLIFCFLVLLALQIVDKHTNKHSLI